ncbi:MAG: hypothetical protein ABI921_08915 [Panacibacter sp.]
MRFLLLLQRVTFICNLLFIFCIIMLFVGNPIASQGIQSIVIILGYIVSLILGFVVNLWEVILLLNRKHSAVPVWLRTFNFVLFVIQLIYRLF